MTTSRDWYGRDWKLLRTQLIKLCLQHCQELLNEVQVKDPDVLAMTNVFLDRVRQDIAARIPLDRLGLWQNSLALMVHPERLARDCEADLEALHGKKTSNGEPVHPRQALARKLQQFLETNRREQVATELGISANKVKTWERLDRISRDMVRQENIGNRCIEEHFEQVARHIKTHHGHDKNLPRRAETVKGYFYRFSSDCLQFIEDRSDTMDKLSLEDAKELLQGVGMADLSHCLQTLSQEQLEILDASFHIGLSRIVYRSVDDYLRNHQLGKVEYGTQLQGILTNLGQCIELRLAARQGGPSS